MSTLEYDDRTALIVVDVQNDFADPGGSLYVPGGETVVPIVNAEIERAREAGATIAYTQDWHPEHTPHFARDGGIWPVHCVGGTWGAELHPGLIVVDGAIRVRKGTGGEDGYSGFTVRDPVSGTETSTGLFDELRHHDISKAAVVGLALDYCVKETALDAARLGLTVVVPADATRAVNLQPGDGFRAAAELARGGVQVI